MVIFKMALNILDRQHVWHPFTQEMNVPYPIHITHARGPYLFSQDGRRYLDLISSWWLNLHGHAHPKIAKAIYEQAQKLEHVIFAGFTHEPAVQLATKLSSLLPTELNRVFYSDNGSTAVEVALKMAYQFWYNQNESERKLFLSFEGGYHGDTFGAMSVGIASNFHNPFKELCFKVAHLPLPDTWIGDPEMDAKEEAALYTLEIYLKQYGSRTAAFIGEPLIQGAGGMRCYRPEFLQKFIERLRVEGILIIFDEVMTGFGRTGTMFAMEQIKAVPDIICLAKGLTGGFLPLAATIVQPKIYNAFLGDTFDKALSHGHSYTANPLGCAAALASLELFEEEKTFKAIAKIEDIHKIGIAKLQSHSGLDKFRTCGTISAFELSGRKRGYDQNISTPLKALFLESGLLIRPLGNVIYMLPPYCIAEQDLLGAYDVIDAVLKNLNLQL